MLVCFRLGTHHITHTLQVLINAGQANAATGDAGYEDCVKSAQAVADALGIDSDQVLIESTGTSTNNQPDHHVADSFALHQGYCYQTAASQPSSTMRFNAL